VWSKTPIIEINLVIKHLKAILVTFLFSITTVMVFFPILFLAVFKLLIPLAPFQKQLHRALDWCASQWMSFNNWQQSVLLPTKIDTQGFEDLSLEQWYLMVANHQSWVDILVILRLFNGRIPYIKFFLKQSLLYIPFMGFCFWALDFPFMRRYSKAQLEKHPELKAKDIERTRKSCEVFRHNPVTIINFMEGTRFTQAKHNQQQSVYRYLLTPKAGGVSFALSAMNGQLKQLLDVTIFYPEKIPTYWEYAGGGVKTIKLHLRQLPITTDLIGDYSADEKYRQNFQACVNQFWQEKDQCLHDFHLAAKE
jgi:1-acyl-sn-glycerol-3-phosphate acyltransferase